MKCLKLFVVAAVIGAALLAAGGASPAAAETVLCTEKASLCSGDKSDGVGTEIRLSLSGTSKITTTFKIIECTKSTIHANVTSTGEEVNATVEALSFEGCNCTINVLKKGTLGLKQIASTVNATFKSTGAEITTQCSSIFGNVHCVYETESTDFGTLEGGNPAKIKITSVLPRATTNALCDEESVWHAEYEVTSPKPLYAEPEKEPSSETILCTEKASLCPVEKADGAGTEIKMGLSGTSKITTTFKTIECSKSTMTSKVTNTGEKVVSAVEALTFEECNCTVNVLKKGTLEVRHIKGTDDATTRSANAEVTISCSTIFGTVHCIYETEATDLGTLESGSPAKIAIVSVPLPREATNALCNEEASWDATYEVTSPKPLYVEPEVEEGTVLCTENANPCSGKADGGGTEIKTSLVAGTKSKLTTPYNNIECGKSSMTAKVTSTGKTIGANLEGLVFEECNCEVKVLSKGTLALEYIASTANATVNSTGTEVTTVCSTIGGNVHCIYKTEATDLGTLEGGNPAKVKISGANIPRLVTDTRCNEGEGTKWDVEYEVTAPKPLYIEPK